MCPALLIHSITSINRQDCTTQHLLLVAGAAILILSQGLSAWRELRTAKPVPGLARAVETFIIAAIIACLCRCFSDFRTGTRPFLRQHLYPVSTL